MSKPEIAHTTSPSVNDSNLASLAVGDGALGGDAVNIVTPLPVVPVPVPAPAPARSRVVGGAVTYATGVRMRILQHTNLIRDLAEIILSYSAFCGEERISVEGHSKSVYCIAVFPNGNYCSGSFDKSIKIWNHEGHCIKTLQGNNVILLNKTIGNFFTFWCMN